MKYASLFFSISFSLTVTGCGGGSSNSTSAPATPVVIPVVTPVISASCTLPPGVDLGKLGSATPKATLTTGGTVLMGGGVDVDEAIKWMIARSGGGDFVVIRSTGTDGYNSYIYNTLGGVNSVQTLLIDSTSEADDACVAQTIQKAGAVFLAGGNQADYVNYFKNRGVGNAINYLINTKHAPVGGTSAGMAIQGQYYHPGGAPEDASGLQDPTLPNVGNGFINNSILNNVVTEPHFTKGTEGAVGTPANPKRRARLTSFMAKMVSSAYNVGWQNVRGIAVDNDTAVAIDENGLAKIFVYTGKTGTAKFIKATGAPEILTAGSPLTWNVSAQALNVYEIPGTTTGSNTFNLTSWSGTGGTSSFWAVNAGTLTTTP